MPAATNTRERIERAIDAFEEAWLAGRKPRVEEFLKDAGHDRATLLVELIFTDLEYRIRAGETNLVEDYGRRFPEIKTNLEQWRHLIVEEFRLRRRFGQTPNWDEYQRRFPDDEQKLQTVLNDGTQAHVEAPAVAMPTGSIKMPSVVKRYRLQRIIAEGGMGFIARVVDTEFDRPLAMKVLSNQLKNDPELQARFLREARLTGQLQHPGIPPVQEKGRLDDGTPYFIMKLIKGHSLQKLLRDRKSPQERLGHFIGVFGSLCQTMAYAHSRGIIHRDLKPGNIMVGAFGEVQVMDWGLAKVLRTGLAVKDSEDGPPAIENLNETAQVLQMRTAMNERTRAGAVMGTPGYMAPEQARGETGTLDQRCDVFGLGGILCDILTGKPPFQSTSKDDARNQALGNMTEAFARLDRCGADAELIVLAKRCLAGNPADRPVDAQSVADAITLYQTHVQERLKQTELEQARLVTKTQEEKKRRRDRRVLGSAIFVLLIAGGLAIYHHFSQHGDAASTTAAKQAALQFDNAIALTNVTSEYLRKGEVAKARQMLKDADVVADAAREIRKTNASKLAPADAREITAKDDAFTTRRKDAERLVVFAEQLDLGFEARGTLTEADFELRWPRVMAFGRGGGKLYQDAFDTFGVKLDNADAAAKQLKTFPGADLACVALCDWMLLEDGTPLATTLNAIGEALDIDPARARLRKGILNRDAELLKKLASDVQTAEPSPEFVIVLVDALQRRRNFGSALDLLQNSQRLRAGHYWLCQTYGAFLSRMRPTKIAEAIDRLEQAHALRPMSTFAAANLIQGLTLDRRLDQAAEVAREHLETVNRQDALITALLADLLIEQSKIVDAEILLGNAPPSQKTSGFLNASIANLYLAQSRDFWTRYRDMSDKKKPAEAFLAKKNANDFAEKARRVAQEFSRTPFSPALEALGNAELKLNNIAKAKSIAQDLMRDLPRDVAGYLLNARAVTASLATNNDGSADPLYADLVKMDPKNPHILEARGVNLLDQHRYDLAFPDFVAAASYAAGRLPGFYEAANAFLFHEHPFAAGWLYAEILKHDPESEAAGRGLEAAIARGFDVRTAITVVGDAAMQQLPAERREYLNNRKRLTIPNRQ